MPILGFNAKLYYQTDGVGGSAGWVEVSAIKDLTLDLEDSESDVTTRANSGWEAVMAALRKTGASFQMPWNPGDTAFDVLLAAMISGAVIGIAVMDGPIATTGTQGLKADMEVMKFDRDESVGEAMMADVVVKPTFSATAPSFVTI